MFDAVPLELRELHNWIVWRSVWQPDRQKYTKQPLSPFTGLLAAVNIPANWTSFDHAVQVYTQHRGNGVDGIGFCFSEGGGVVGVDLDRVFNTDGTIADYNAEQLANDLNSYTEISPSGNGLHVFVKADFIGGVRRQNVEIYGGGRFFTVTGRPYGAPRALAERQSNIDAIINAIRDERNSKTRVILDWSLMPTQSNEAIIQMASLASNGDKFKALWAGQYLGEYRSQSEADFALIDILGFYSNSPAQIREMFLTSGLGQREKARRGEYVGGMIQRAFDNRAPLVTLAAPIAPAVTTTPEPIAPELDEEEQEERDAMASSPYTAPPGLVGEIASWIFYQSRWPMQELALIGALGLMAGICGRQYQFGGSGLNLYMMFLAGTGSGKEALSHAISKVFTALDAPPPPPPPGMSAPVNANRYSDYYGVTSLTGKGLVRFFANSITSSCVSVVPEFSQVMSQMADPRAHSGLREFQQMLLDFYMKSSEGQRYGGAMNADKADDIRMLNSPAFSLICEGTPERFWRSMTEYMVTDGLMSRFIVFEREQYVMTRNELSDTYRNPPPDMINKIKTICDFIAVMRDHETRCYVGITPEASALSRKLEDHYRKRGADNSNTIYRALWMRAHQNIMRIAGLVAIGVNMSHPTITPELVLWADNILRRQVHLIAGKFKRGDIGDVDDSERDQYAKLSDVLEKYMARRPDQNKSAKVAEARAVGIISLEYIEAKCRNVAAFRKARFGVSDSLRKALQHFERLGKIKTVSFNGKDGCYYRVNL